VNLRSVWRSGVATRIAIVVLGIIVLSTIFANVLAPYSPLEIDVTAIMQPPTWHHLLGTDELGRDILSRMLYGGRLSLTVGLVAVAIEFSVGMVVGVLTGYVGGFIDTIVMRVVDVMLAMPGLIFALFIVAILGPGLVNVMIALGIGGIPGIVRVARASTLAFREREFVEGARAVGASLWRITIHHLMPNILPPILVLVFLDIGGYILSASALSFIGLGAQPPSPEWGAMLAQGRNYFPEAWWMTVYPGLLIGAVVLCVNIIGDTFRDALDPALRGSIGQPRSAIQDLRAAASKSDGLEAAAD
jgi:peptide/nickel transport system permease protein